MTDLDDTARGRRGHAVGLLERLVAEPSLEGSAAIERCLDIVAADVAPLGPELHRPSCDGLTSLIARFGSAPPERRLAFSGHVDVVPAEGDWATPPFRLAHRDGRLHGRGTCDMKGGVAAFCAALHALADADRLDSCSVELVLTGDEEIGSRRGLIPLLERGLVTATRAVCGEPTGLDVYLGNRGLVWATVTIRGRGGHAGQAHHLASPIPAATAVIDALHRMPLDAHDERFDPPRSSLTVTRIDAGAAVDAVNVIPDTVTLGLDRRLLPGEDPDRAVEAIEATVRGAVPRQFGHRVEVLRRWPAYAIRPEDAIARIACDTVRAVGRPVALGMDSAANDSSWLHRAGIPTVLLGPGGPEQAHVTDEALAEDELRDAVRIYARMATATAAA